MKFSVVAAATILAAAQGTYAAGLISGAARVGSAAARGAKAGADIAGAATSANNNNNNGKRETAQQWESEVTNCLHEYTQDPNFTMDHNSANAVRLNNVGPQCMTMAKNYAADPASKKLDPVFGTLVVTGANSLELHNIPASYMPTVQAAIDDEKAAQAGQH